MVAPELVGRFRADCEALTGGPPLRLGVAVSGGPDSLALLPQPVIDRDRRYGAGKGGIGEQEEGEAVRSAGNRDPEPERSSAGQRLAIGPKPADELWRDRHLRGLVMPLAAAREEWRGLRPASVAQEGLAPASFGKFDTASS